MLLGRLEQRAPRLAALTNGQRLGVEAGRLGEQHARGRGLLCSAVNLSIRSGGGRMAERVWRGRPRHGRRAPCRPGRSRPATAIAVAELSEPS